MRFSGPEPLTTPWAFERTGIIKIVRQKLNVPSERRIMGRPHVFSCDINRSPVIGSPARTKPGSVLEHPRCLGKVRRDRIHESRRKAVVRFETQLLQPSPY